MSLLNINDSTGIQYTPGTLWVPNILVFGNGHSLTTCLSWLQYPPSASRQCRFHWNVLCVELFVDFCVMCKFNRLICCSILKLPFSVIEERGGFPGESRGGSSRGGRGRGTPTRGRGGKQKYVLNSLWLTRNP